jgi:signal transduction histidine kinase
MNSLAHTKFGLYATCTVIALVAANTGRLLLLYMMQVPPYDEAIKWVVNIFGMLPVTLVIGVIVFLTVRGLLLREKLVEISPSRMPVNAASAPGSFFYTFRWKLLLLFLISMIITALLVVAAHLIVYAYYQSNPDHPLLNWIINTIGSSIVMGIAGCTLFVVVFYWMTSRTIGYFKEITTGVQHIAQGSLDYRIPLKSVDELGMLAHQINEMSNQLSLSLQEERNAEKTKNDLITGVSHDLRTPLTSILGFLELIEEDRYQDEIELRHYVHIAYEKSLGLRLLIDQLFEYTKYSSDLKLELRELDVTGLIYQLAEEFVPSMEKVGMECRVKASGAPLLIMAEGESLVRAFENLIGNALHYGAQGKYVDIQIAADGDDAVIKFINYGEPIPQQDLPHLFERFYRVEQSRSKNTGGTGLGLAIVKSIVELHNGGVSVNSNKRETVFETRFPLHTGEKPVHS